MSSQTGGKLVGEGSYGNVFYPALPCQTPLDKDYDLSKLFISKQGKKIAIKEVNQGKKIKLIPNYKDWAWIWHMGCVPKNYQSLQKLDSDIKGLQNQTTIQQINHNKYMLLGYHGGISLPKLIQDIFTKEIFQERDRFIPAFYNYMDLCNSLLLGIKELYTHKLSHNDIKIDNVVVWIRPRGEFIQEFREKQYAPGRWNRCGVDGLKLIDFGISCSHSDIGTFVDRSTIEYITPRISLNYPYEYIYCNVSQELLQDELDDFSQKYYRELHGIFKEIHETIFQRQSINKSIQSLIVQFRKKPLKANEKKKLYTLIDTYSLGIALMLPLYTASLYNDQVNQLKSHLRSSKIKPFMELLKQMTELSYKDRINPVDAFRTHTKLITG